MFFWRRRRKKKKKKRKSWLTPLRRAQFFMLFITVGAVTGIGMLLHAGPTVSVVIGFIVGLAFSLFDSWVRRRQSDPKLVIFTFYGSVIAHGLIVFVFATMAADSITAQFTAILLGILAVWSIEVWRLRIVRVAKHKRPGRDKKLLDLIFKVDAFVNQFTISSIVFIAAIQVVTGWQLLTPLGFLLALPIAWVDYRMKVGPVDPRLEKFFYLSLALRGLTIMLVVMIASLTLSHAIFLQLGGIIASIVLAVMIEKKHYEIIKS